MVRSSATWSTVNKNINVAITGAGLVATSSGAGAGVNVAGRGTTETTSLGAGRARYFEITITNDPGDNGAFVGFSRVGEPFLDNFYLGSSTETVGWLIDGSLFYNAASAGSTSPYAEGDILTICVNDHQFYPGVNGVFAGDPVAGTGGVTLGGDFVGVDFYPAYNLKDGGIVTANFGPTFAFPIPAGYSAFP